MSGEKLYFLSWVANLLNIVNIEGIEAAHRGLVHRSAVAQQFLQRAQVRGTVAFVRCLARLRQCRPAVVYCENIEDWLPVAYLCALLLFFFFAFLVQRRDGLFYLGKNPTEYINHKIDLRLGNDQRRFNPHRAIGIKRCRYQYTAME